MTAKSLVDPEGLSKAQLDLIQQFEADYNAIDHFLRKSLGNDKQTPFRRLVDEYSKKFVFWTDAELLKTIGEVRNMMIHGKTEPYRYVVSVLE